MQFPENGGQSLHGKAQLGHAEVPDSSLPWYLVLWAVLPSGGHQPCLHAAPAAEPEPLSRSLGNKDAENSRELYLFFSY